MRDHGALVIQACPQQDRRRRAGQRKKLRFAAEHPRQETAQEGEAGNAHPQGQQSKGGREDDAPP